MGLFGPPNIEKMEAKADIKGLVSLLGNKDYKLRQKAADSLVNIGKPAVPALVDMLINSTSNDADEHNMAIKVLGKIGPDAQEAVPILVDRFVNKYWDEAAKSLKQIGIVAVHALIDILEHKENVNDRVPKALGIIGPEAKEAVPALTDALNNKYYGVRMEAARALGKIGPEAKGAIPTLKNALQDENKEVQKAVAEALQKIEGSNISAQGDMDRAFKEINSLIREEHWGKVITKCQKLLESSESADYRGDINTAMGIAYIAKSDLESAFTCFKKASDVHLAHVFLRHIYTCVMNGDGEDREMKILKDKFNSHTTLLDKDLRRIGIAVSCADEEIVDKIRHD